MPNIRVALRVRPLSQREIEGNYPVVVAFENNSAFITDIRVPERPSADSRQRFRQFDFDHTFWFSNNGVARCAASQQEVYREMGPNLEKAILAGYNACLLAYGQSGSGKTHTMIGTRDDPGIIPRLCHSLWDKLNTTYPPQQSTGKANFRMEVSFLEIYREKVKDLLSPDKSLKLREHPQLGPHVQGLTRLEVTEEISLLDLLWEGERRRATGNTTSNRRSSRSHAIWTLYLTVYTTRSVNIDRDNGANNNNNDDRRPSRTGQERSNYSPGANPSSCNRPGENDAVDSGQSVITNQVHLVDLAGSEKADCTTAKSLLAEGADINRSLVALGNVISALAEKAQYVPYRDSALTWLLKDSIGGNASTSIIITASPSSHSHAQTLNSLRFAQRARLVENTPKINLASSSSNQYGPYGFLSVMSAMELKKDISRLAKIIKTAQTNGGILRGLAPRAGWTRLIHAIEGIGQAEKEQVKLQRERACSEDTTGSSSYGVGRGSSPSTAGATSSSSGTLTAAKSLNDVMVQANMEKRRPLLSLRRRMSRQSEPALLSSSSSSPTKVVGTEVFIPTSNSYKCLTWQQEETHPVPKPISSSTSSLLSTDEPDEDGSSTLQSASSNTQIHHLKYLLEVQYPVTHNLDRASRISEKIHGSFCDDNYQQKTTLLPVEVQPEMDAGEEPLVHGLIPTLVQPRDFNEILNEQVEVESPDAINKKVINHKSVLVCSRAKEEKDYLFPTKCKYFATHAPCSTIAISPLESSDEDAFEEPEQIDMSGSQNLLRAVHPDTSKNLQRALDDSWNLDDTCYFTGGESVLSQKPIMIISSSSSSYESINFPDPVRPVNLIREFSKFSDEFEEGCLQDLTIGDSEVFQEDFVPPVANVCLVPGQPMDTAVPIEILVEEPNCLDTAPCYNPINGVSDSKFRNYFAKELHQMERMGKQIKSLLQMTQRYNVVKPYLDEISHLQNSDHSKPDPVDAHIDSCSGWNVDVELAKVHQEIHQLNKVLKTGLGQEGMINSGNGNKGSTSNKAPKTLKSSGNYKNTNNNNNITPGKYIASSSTSTVNNDVGITSDSSVDADGCYPSYAHMRQIPMLSGVKVSASSLGIGGDKTSHQNKMKRPNPHSAKGSVSQPILSSGSTSNNGSISNVPATSVHFTPNYYSTPHKQGQPYRPSYKSSLWANRGEGGFSDMEEEFFRSHQQPPVVAFRPHPAPSSVNSFQTFYRNAAGGTSNGSHNHFGGQYHPSNMNMSTSVGSNASLMNCEPGNFGQDSSSGSTGYPLNISYSEPRKIPGLFGRAQSKGSENSSGFLPFHNHSPDFHNSFNTDEVRSHRHLYESDVSVGGCGETSGRFSSLTKDTDEWLPNGMSGRAIKKLQKFASEDSSSGYLPYHHPRSHSDSLDLCSCGDTNSKYSSSVAAPLSSLDKTSVRSRFSSFGGSTTTDTSDQYSKMWSATDYFSHNAEQSFPYHNHSNLPNHSKGLSNGHTLDLLKPSNTNGVASVPPHLPAHHHNLYKQFARINRNDNF